MRAWFSKFRISLALDSGKPLPQPLRRAIEQSGPLREFEHVLTDLDRGLKQVGPLIPRLPDEVHRSIMREVESCRSRRPSRGAHHRLVLRWLPASGLALVVAVGAWLIWRQGFEFAPGGDSTASEHFQPALLMLETGERLAQATPTTVVMPLTDEWARLNHDVERAEQFLLASVP